MDSNESWACLPPKVHPSCEPTSVRHWWSIPILAQAEVGGRMGCLWWCLIWKESRGVKYQLKMSALCSCTASESQLSRGASTCEMWTDSWGSSWICRASSQSRRGCGRDTIPKRYILKPGKCPERGTSFPRHSSPQKKSEHLKTSRFASLCVLLAFSSFNTFLPPPHSFLHVCFSVGEIICSESTCCLVALLGQGFQLIDFHGKNQFPFHWCPTRSYVRPWGGIWVTVPHSLPLQGDSCLQLTHGSFEAWGSLVERI